MKERRLGNEVTISAASFRDAVARSSLNAHQCGCRRRGVGLHHITHSIHSVAIDIGRVVDASATASLAWLGWRLCRYVCLCTCFTKYLLV